MMAKLRQLATAWAAPTIQEDVAQSALPAPQPGEVVSHAPPPEVEEEAPVVVDATKVRASHVLSMFMKGFSVPSADFKELTKHLDGTAAMKKSLASGGTNDQHRLWYWDAAIDLDVAEAWLKNHSPYTRRPGVDVDSLQRAFKAFGELATDSDVLRIVHCGPSWQEGKPFAIA